MRVRWSAVGVALVALAALVAGRLWLAEYAGALTAAARPSWRSRNVFDLSVLAPMLLPWAAVAVLAFALAWRSPHWWGRISLVATVPTALVTAFPPFGAQALVGAERVLVSGAPAWSALTVAAGLALAVAAARMLTRPGADVATSGVHLRFPLRDGKARLLVAEDRVRLLRPQPVTPGHQRVRELNNLAIPFGRIDTVDPVHLSGLPAAHPLPNGTAVPLSEGPGLRITGGGQEWLLPVERPDTIADLVRARAHAHPGRHAPAPTQEQWQQLMRRREAIRRSGTGKGSRAPRYYGPGTAVFGALTVASFVANDGWFGKLAGATVFGVCTLGCWLAWGSSRETVRLGEEWPEPPVG